MKAKKWFAILACSTVMCIVMVMAFFAFNRVGIHPGDIGVQQGLAIEKINVEVHSGMIYLKTIFEINSNGEIRRYEQGQNEFFEPATASYNAPPAKTVYKKTISETQFAAIEKAVARCDFLYLPEELAPWNGCDGPGETIEVYTGGGSHRVSGYYATQTTPRFAHVWEAMAQAGVFTEEGYVQAANEEL